MNGAVKRTYLRRAYSYIRQFLQSFVVLRKENKVVLGRKAEREGLWKSMLPEAVVQEEEGEKVEECYVLAEGYEVT